MNQAISGFATQLLFTLTFIMILHFLKRSTSHFQTPDQKAISTGMSHVTDWLDKVKTYFLILLSTYGVSASVLGIKHQRLIYLPLQVIAYPY